MAAPVADNWNTLEILTASKSVNVEAVSTVIARICCVETEEVAILRVYGFSLEFLCPVALKSAGRIPLSASAVAARIAGSKIPEIYNEFATVNHSESFEAVPLGRVTRKDVDSKRIQKMMAAPIMDSKGKSVGVIEVSRKGKTRNEAGPDFTDYDLKKLVRVAQSLSAMLEEY